MRKRKAREMIAWFSMRFDDSSEENEWLWKPRFSYWFDYQLLFRKQARAPVLQKFLKGGGGGRKLPINVTRGYSQIIRQLSSKMRSYPCHDFRQTDSWRKLIGLMRWGGKEGGEGEGSSLSNPTPWISHCVASCLVVYVAIWFAQMSIDL